MIAQEASQDIALGLHEVSTEKTKTKRNNFLGKKFVREKTSSNKIFKTTDKEKETIREILGLREVSRHKIEKRSEVTEAKSEKKGMFNRSMAVSDRISSVLLFGLIA